MAERILFLTGRLAEKSLRRVLEEELSDAGFEWEVLQIGISVAGLMTADLIRRRVSDTRGAQRIVVPGRCRGDLEALTAHFGIPVQRGPEELKDLPQWFGRAGRRADLSRHDILVFAEIVDAPNLDVPGILERAARYRRDGADVIDLGCLPDTPFPHLEESVQALKQAGFAVSVDSLHEDDLLRGGRAGADYLLSLKLETLHLAEEVGSTPVLIPSHPGDMDSLYAAIEAMERRGRRYLADSILDPIHFGFTDSLVRYHALRRRFPAAPIMMGIGNLTELTEADTTGINALLFGIGSELGIAAVLATEVSPHCRSAVREADLARRIMYAAREEHALPKGFHGGLACVHARKPFPDTPEEIAALAGQVKDPSYRIQVSADGVHVYNRDGHYVAADPFDLYPKLGVEDDGGHAFYLGVELARAQIAYQLGKRYTQDEELDWGAALPAREQDLSRQKAAGTTLSHALRQKAKA